MNYCLFASKQGLLFESHALFDGVNIIGMGVNIVRIRRSKNAAKILVKNGYKVIELDEGYNGWVSKGMPVTKQYSSFQTFLP